MRKISEMYRRSGGTIPFRYCSECKLFRKEKQPYCGNYEPEVMWKETYPACRFFEPDKKDGKHTVFGFISVYEEKKIDAETAMPEKPDIHQVRKVEGSKDDIAGQITLFDLLR